MAFNFKFTSTILLLLVDFYGLCSANAEISVKRQEEIKYMLFQDCGSCHGMTLKGGLGLPLTPENLKNKPESFIVETILNGRAGTAMPPWKNFLTNEEALWLAKELKKGFSK